MDVKATAARQADRLIFVAALVTAGLAGQALDTVLGFSCACWAVRVTDTMEYILGVTVT